MTNEPQGGQVWDLVICGGGASGLFAGIFAAQAGRRVLILEHGSKPGRKLALCGGGNANVGPRELTAEELSERYGAWTSKGRGPARGLKKLYQDIEPSLVKAIFEESSTIALPGIGGDHPLVVQGLGIRLRELQGQFFPKDYDALGLVQYLTEQFTRAGGTLVLNRGVQSVRSAQGLWKVETSQGTTYGARACLLALGGNSYPAAGGSNRGLEILESIGVPCHQGLPSMGSLRLAGREVTKASGCVVKAKIFTRKGSGGKITFTSHVDDVLITHRGLSGPLVLDTCGRIHVGHGEGLFTYCNFVPQENTESLQVQWDKFIKDHPKKQAWNLLAPILPRALAEALLTEAGLDPSMELTHISRSVRIEASRLATEYPIPYLGPTSWHEAMGWTGGIESSALDWSTMEVKGQPGLYVSGDLVALDRPCGGYSLWFAWTSALAVVRSVVKT